MLPIIQGLWVGAPLSKMEQLCIKSFLYWGHEFHLYVYEPIENIPTGTIIKDANEILTKDSVFTYQNGDERGSFAGFSNYFRYKLMYEKGGFWVDMDTICLKPFDFTTPYVFSSELNGEGVEKVNCGIICAPVANAICLDGYNTCISKNNKTIQFGETGPKLIQQLVDKYNMTQYVKSYNVFCPIHYNNVADLLKENSTIDEFMAEITHTSYAIHLWNELWRRLKINKNGIFPASSIYQYLLDKYGVC